MMNIQELLKEGTKHLSGLDEAVLRNVAAAKKLSDITRTSFGPNGMNKMVINHLEKLFVTSDCATIIKELDVVHPAAKLLVLAAQMQEQEVGDCSNLVLMLAGELLHKADGLLRMGLHPSEVISGYQKAGKKALEYLLDPALVVHTVKDAHDSPQVLAAVRTAIAAKRYGYEDILAPLVVNACIQVCPKNVANFNVDSVRVAKIVGGAIADTVAVKGFVLARDAEGTIKHVRDAKVAVYAAGIDSGKTETKGTVLIHNATELLDFSRGEERQMEQSIKDIAATGVKVIVSGAGVGELALHFIERYKMMVVKVLSKFELRRLCKATGATALIKLSAPTAEELGKCDEVTVQEIGGTKVTLFRQESELSRISTLIVRGSTDNILDDIERAIDDGVNVFKALCKDGECVAGAGACEVELARHLQSFGESTPGLDQYAIKKFAEAFEVVPRTLAETAGHNATDMISNLFAAHQKPAQIHFGVDVETGTVADAVSREIFDVRQAKYSAIKLATNATVTILRVDQIIMSKPAGGPKPPKQGAGGDRDD